MIFFLKVCYSCKTSCAKHLPHGEIDLCWLSEILWWNLKAFHRTFIISVSVSHMTPCLINYNSEELFANISVSLVRSMSCSAPTHTKVEVAGLTNDQYTRLSGFSKKVFPQLTGPMIKLFRNFPPPLCTSSFTALLNFSTDISFCCRVCRVCFCIFINYNKVLEGTSFSFFSFLIFRQSWQNHWEKVLKPLPPKSMLSL